ncbi:MAG: ParB/RepB/Spo0J family partition protein [Bacteroidales bacterium]|nr:ParB/RepB/Spo0J family partition protein [Bacteroidales bacterium]
MAIKKTPALGKGLEALLGNIDTKTSTDKNISSVTAELCYIPIDKILPNPDQPRKEFDQTALEELAQSIKESGVIVPITVKKENDKYFLIAGERRFRASKIAGLKEIPAYIKIATKQEVMEMALVENIQREDLNAIEIALSLKALIEECNITQEKMSECIGKSRSTITNHLRLLKLPADVQLALRNNKISMGHARSLIGIEDEQTQISIVKDIIEKDLSVRQVEQIVNRLKSEEKPQTKNNTKKKSLPEFHNTKKENLIKKLDTQIEITRSQRGKGAITISFKNDEDFQRIISLLE